MKNHWKEDGHVIEICHSRVFGRQKLQKLIKLTLKMYRQNLGLFLDYCTLNNILNVEDIRSNVVKAYMLRCKEEGNKPSTMNNKLRSIKVFFNYLVEEEIIEKTLQKILRHEDITMTQRYVNLWGTALKQQNDKYNPLNNIDIG